MRETGPYLTPTTSSRQDPGNLSLFFRGAFQRPDCVDSPNVATGGSKFNINAFNPVPAGPVGTRGVGILLRPGASTIAAGLAKDFQLTERFRLALKVPSLIR